MSKNKYRIAIVTQPLLNNYGGLLQNFALQKILKQLNYDSITIDVLNIQKEPLWPFIFSWIKTILLLILTWKNRGFAKQKKYIFRQKWSQKFISSFINKTKTYRKYSNEILKKKNIKAVIVGSDQVWRPKYNENLYDMFLDFCKENKQIKRLSYAASFGVDCWEYTSEQTKICSVLAKQFNNISVREKSAIQLCSKYLNTDASWVLDPTLLLKKEDYYEVCKKIPKTTEKILVAYILDINDSILSLCNSIAQKKHLKLKLFEAGPKASITVPEWLAMFRDASYVITDSYHGTIFSIIFGKKFKCIPNKSRGPTRIQSILNLYYSKEIDKKRQESLNWLKKSLK